MKIEEFHYITPIENIPSILERGILSYERIAAMPHSSIAMPEVQAKRDGVQIPGGLKLHQYANFYLHARNPMMYKRQAEVDDLCVLQISTDARHLPDCVLADRNASSDYVRFLAIKDARELDLAAIYADDWRHPDDQIAYLRHRSIKCAEFLVPHHLPLKFVKGAYVVSQQSESELKEKGFNLPVTIDTNLFFR